jgi:hypothetical protein
MASPEGNIVELMLVTGDDTLAADFAAELEERGTGNPVTRHKNLQAGIDNLDSLSGNAPGQPSQIIILDLRNAQREGIRFLNELHNRRPFNEPIVLIIGGDGHEVENLSRHERYIAGQLPETGTGTAFVEWAASMLSPNWTFEKTKSDN